MAGSLFTSRVHLDRSKTLFLSVFRPFDDVRCPIAAYPSIYSNAIPYFASEQLPNRDAQLLAFDIPQSNIQA
jgi:hypothetical protein